MKQRLVGAAVLVALAVIFLPMLVQGPAPDSGVSGVPLSMPDVPPGNYETRDLPLVTPGNAPEGGAVGMPSTPTTTPATPTTATSAPAALPADPGASSSQPVALDSDAAAQTDALPQPVPAAEDRLPAVTAAGDYAVSFGTYATPAAADAALATLRASQLPARRETTTVNGKPAWRVRIGPYASRADAEIARLRAARVPSGDAARVVVLDAQPPAAAGAPPATDKPTNPPAPISVASAPGGSTPPAAQVASNPAAAAATGFAVQIAAYSNASQATALRDKLRAAGFTAFTESVSTDKGTLTRVRVGPVITRADADQLQAQIKAKSGLDGVVRPHP